MTLLDIFLENERLRAEWAADLNGEAEPRTISSGSRQKLWWRCKQGHEWRSAVYSRAQDGCGCPYCAGLKAIPGETDLATTHPELLKLWSPNNSLSPGELSAGSHEKVLWRCEKGHEWTARVDTVSGGCGCPYCAGLRAIPGETDLATLCPELMSQWDYELNSDADPAALSPGSRRKVWWRCEKGHSWQAMIFSRSGEKGADCPYCSGKKVLPGFNDLATLRPGLAEEWYQPLNGNLRPEEVSLGSNKKVWWRCGERHVWQAYIYARTKANGTGCPVCAGKVKAPRRSESFSLRTEIRPTL